MDILKKLTFIIPLLLIGGFIFVRDRNKKAANRRRTLKARRTRSQNSKSKTRKKRSSQSSSKPRTKKSGTKTWRNTPRAKWTKKMGQAWAKFMKSKRKK